MDSDRVSANCPHTESKERDEDSPRRREKGAGGTEKAKEEKITVTSALIGRHLNLIQKKNFRQNSDTIRQKDVETKRDRVSPCESDRKIAQV